MGNTSEPLSIRAGDTAKWTKKFPDYPASDGWTLSYAFQNSTTRIEVDAGDVTADGDSFSVLIPTTETEDWDAGQYAVAGYVSKGGERYTVVSNSIQILPDLGDATLEDTRSENQKVLDSINAAIATRVTSGVLSYSIADRSITYSSLDDLMKLKNIYAAKVMRERGTEIKSYGAQFSRV